MIKIYKAYKFRLYPTNNQKNTINQTFGNLRFIYNYYANKITTQGYKSVYNNYNDCEKELLHKYPFLEQTEKNLIKKVLYRLDDNYKKNQYKGISTIKYKSKYEKNSYTIPASYTYNKDLKVKKCNIIPNLPNQTLELPQIGSLKIRGYKNKLKVIGEIKNVTITREQTGKYYIIILCNIPNFPKVNPNTIIGLDIGIKKLVTTSDGLVYTNNKYINQYETKIKREQYKLSKKQKGSKNYYKNINRLNILYAKLRNARKYTTHKITKEITDNYDIIVTETLTIKKMIMNKDSNLSKNIADATFSEIIRELEYKSKEKGKYLYKIKAYYPSSQLCSICENRAKEYKDLTKRVYECSYCQNTLDRDINASINIMFEGLKLYLKDQFP